MTPPDSPKDQHAEGADAAPHLRFRIRVTTADTVAIGPGKIALLEAIQDCGTLTAAAKHLGLSYRRAWLMLDELNRALVQPATTSAHGGARGGGSQLTATGQRLIDLYREIEHTAQHACAQPIQALLDLLPHETSR